MDLTRHQLAILETYQRWRRDPPTYWTLMASNDWRRLVLLGVTVGAIGYVLYLAGAALGGLLFLGIWIGEVIAESGRLRHTASVWPVLSRTLDWTRVERAISDKRLA